MAVVPDIIAVTDEVTVDIEVVTDMVALTQKDLTDRRSADGLRVWLAKGPPLMMLSSY